MIPEIYVNSSVVQKEKLPSLENEIRKQEPLKRILLRYVLHGFLFLLSYEITCCILLQTSPQNDQKNSSPAL